MMEFKQDDVVQTRCNLLSHDGEAAIGTGSIGRVTVVGIELSDGSTNGIEVLFDNGIYGHYNTTQLVKMEDRPEMLEDGDFDPQAQATALVKMLFYSENCEFVLDMKDIYVVWFCKTLQNWKCMISTNAKDDAYYEVTHNGDKNETYVDQYLKNVNARVSYTNTGGAVVDLTKTDRFIF